MAVYQFCTLRGVADAGQEEALARLTEEMGRPDAKILLHLHGGLVDEAAGKAAAARLSGHGPSSFNLGPEWTQIYVIWRTGALEEIRNNWQDLARNDRLYQAICKKLISFVSGRLGIPGAAARGAGTLALDEEEILRRIRGERDQRAPFADVDQYLVPAPTVGARATIAVPQSNGGLVIDFQEALADDPDFQKAVADIDGVANEGGPHRAALPAADRARGSSSLSRLDPAIQAELAPPVGAAGERGLVSVGMFLLKHAGAIALRCFKRFRTGRDHGLHATIVEEVCRELYGDIVGAAIWATMVDDAGRHFGPAGFGRALLEALPAGGANKLVVTAHSAGSIWAARMLLALKEASSGTNVELFLLAPAARATLFAEAVAEAGSHIGRCRMFTMDDEHERADAVLGHDKGWIYPSSLLYLVSGLFESQGLDAYPDAPLLGMQRFAAAAWLDPTEAGDAGSIASFFQKPDKGIVYGPAAGTSEADAHGAFDDDPATLASLHGLF